MTADGGKVFGGPRFKTPFGLLFGPPREMPKQDRGRQSEEAGRIVELVRTHYVVRSVKFDEAGVYVNVVLDIKENEKPFDSLRLDLKKMGMYPRLTRAGRDWIVVIYPFPPRKRRKITTNIVMFLLTLFTTIWAGAFIWANRTGSTDAMDIFTVLLSPTYLLMGFVTFAFPLLLILGTHELGHYFTSRYYKVDASLPYFIPIPPIISPFGTFGALISMRENMSNRKALVDIGVAGPIAGFIIAIPVTIIGLLLTNAYPASSELVDGASYMIFNDPIILTFFTWIIPIAGDTAVFPTVIAGWIGFLVTAMNLLPIGQLDGGHITRGILGDKAKYISYGAVMLLVILGFVTEFKSYLLFALLIMLMGTRHPPPLDDISPLSKRQYAAGAFAILMMLLCFHPIPIEIIQAQSPDVQVYGPESNITVSDLAPVRMDVMVENGASSPEAISMTIEYDGVLIVPEHLYPDHGLDPERFENAINRSQLFYDLDGWYVFSESPAEREIAGKGTLKWTFHLAASSNISQDANTSFWMHFSYADRVETAEVFLERGEIGAYIEKGRLSGDNAYRISGNFHTFSSGPIQTEISLSTTGARRGWDLLLIPESPDNWSLKDGGISRASSGEGEEVQIVLGNISWPEGDGYQEEGFTLEIWLGGDVGPEGMVLNLTIDGGPAGSRSMEITIL
ncbi:MAG: site-2 protease family protein [Thermoplasmata archaeon]|nr:site-2 protease family protein [Thermoplasmata archaeon]